MRRKTVDRILTGVFVATAIIIAALATLPELFETTPIGWVSTAFVAVAALGIGVYESVRGWCRGIREKGHEKE